MFKSKELAMAVCLFSWGVMTSPFANELYVFPAEGQTNEELEFDKFTCYGWAKDNSGFDPMTVPTANSAPPAKETGSGGVVKGALAGAALGAVVGDRSKYAKRGAATGAVVGGVRQDSANAQSNQRFNDWERQESARYIHDRNSYNRAYTACLEGKGYTVK
ncbi:MAG: hypothetical protein IMF04_00540 [Proteobacteria bacterium]|nr:hypothetical protein [Pseudomonadota bacterium]